MRQSGETTGTGKWAHPGVPHRGWICVGIEDREGPEHLCEMCEARTVRYVHVMEHRDYPEPLGVGCICAGHMEQDLARAQHREAQFRNGRSRRSRWLHRRWRRSRAGNDFIRTPDGFHVVVFLNPETGTWGARVQHIASGYTRTSKLPYRTDDSAKLAAFDAMLGMRHAEPWRTRS